MEQAVLVLPAVGDPLVLGDGRTIMPDVEDDFAPTISINDVAAPSEYRPSVRRAFRDFAATPKSLRAVAVVFVFTSLGVSDREIVEELSISQENIDELRKTASYAEVFDAMLNEFININSGLLQSRIHSYSHSALSKVAHLASHALKEETAFTASKDILDRAGTRPQDMVKNQLSSGNELRITITRKDNEIIIDA